MSQWDWAGGWRAAYHAKLVAVDLAIAINVKEFERLLEILELLF